MNLLLIIDPQNDFCNPGDENGVGKGSLYVNGAETDMRNLAWWIRANNDTIDHIAVTLDNHYLNDIAHPNYWEDETGKNPEPFTSITSKDVEEKKWLPLFAYDRTLEYLKKLESYNTYPHTIWSEHCLIGSEGAAIYKPVFEAITQWQKNGTFFQPIMKGAYPFSEHFGAFAAQVMFDDAPETQLNNQLIDEIGTFDNVFLAGEAKSHCVANTLKQIIDYAPGLVEKLIILEDTMSDVTGFENFAQNIYDKAKQLGAKFKTTKDFE
jgi:nicotinamidase-related amidase